MARWLLAALLALCAVPGLAEDPIEEQVRKAAGPGASEQTVAAIRSRLRRELKAMPDRPAIADREAVKRYLQQLEALGVRTADRLATGNDLDRRAAKAMYDLIKSAMGDQRYASAVPPRRGPQADGPAAPPNPSNPTPGRQLPPELQGREQFTRAFAEARPDDPVPQADLGAIRYYQGDSRGALGRLSRAIELGDRSAGTLTLYGRSAYHLGDYETAHRAAKAALERDPSNADAQALLKLSHGKPSSSKVDNALARVRPLDESAIAALEQAAQGPPALRAEESTADYARRAELAAAAARQAVAAPDRIQQSAAKAREAERALRMRDYEGTIVRASAAIELNRSNAQAWNYRAMASARLGKLSDAVFDSTFAISLDQKQAAPWATRSWAFTKQGLFIEGEQDARMALELAPDSPQASLMLAAALDGQKRRPEALSALRAAAARDARLEPLLEKALQLGTNEDMSFLFGDSPAAAAAAAPTSKSRRFVRLVLLTISGGLLVAIGLLQIFAAGWREKVHATIRRALAAGAPPPPAPAPATGFWAQYQLVKELGSGGMGVVYEAIDRSLDRRVAVKRMRDELKRDPKERARFVQEAKTVARLRHPNIVEIYSIVEEGDDVFLVFEHVQGRTLAERLQDGPLTLAEARRLAAGACAAVDYAHAQGVVHRDIKPSNIMLCADGAVKVMDFGVARQAKDALTKASLTNTVVGTPPYMAPEQEQGTVRRESDVFALGVVLFESLTGRLPFAGSGAGMLLNKLNGKRQPLTCPTPAPAGLESVLAKALAPDPDARYKRAAELTDALERLALAAA